LIKNIMKKERGNENERNATEIWWGNNAKR
jgi:hypothetical protein